MRHLFVMGLSRGFDATAAGAPTRRIPSVPFSKCMLLFVMLVCAGVIGLAGCGTKELTRAKAAKLITAANGYPRPITFKLWIGKVAVAKDERGNLGALVPYTDKNALDWARNYIPLIRAGMITATDTGEAIEGWAAHVHLVSYHDIRVTEKLGDCGPTLESEGHKYVALRYYDVELAEVTGIRMGTDEHHAVAEYVVQAKNLSDAYRAMHGDAPPKWTYTAEFVLYDDGWRLIR